MVNSSSSLPFFRALFSSFFSSIALETQTSNIQSILVNAIGFSLLEKFGNLQVRRVTLVKNNNLLQGVTSGLFCFKDWALNKKTVSVTWCRHLCRCRFNEIERVSAANALVWNEPIYLASKQVVKVFSNDNGSLMKTQFGRQWERVEEEGGRVRRLLSSNEKVLWIQPGRG